MSSIDIPKAIHHGRNLKRVREIMGIKQDALASELGSDWHQRKVSFLEAKETIEPELLDQLAKALKVPVEAIRDSTEDSVMYNIQNNYEGSNNHGAINSHHQCTFNPLDEYRNEVQEIKRLNDENKKLYEALLKTEREKIALLERLLNEKK